MVCRRRLADLTQRLHAHGRRYGREAYNRCPRTPPVSRGPGRWRIAAAAVSGVIAVLFSLLGLTVSTVAFVVALPFFLATVVLWRQGARRVGAGPRRQGTRTKQRSRGRADRRRSEPAAPATDPGPAVSVADARSILGVSAGADEATIRRAYRERIKEAHPDQGGDEERFREVTAAYETLRTDTER